MNNAEVLSKIEGSFRYYYYLGQNT